MMIDMMLPNAIIFNGQMKIWVWNYGFRSYISTEMISYDGRCDASKRMIFWDRVKVEFHCSFQFHGWSCMISYFDQTIACFDWSEPSQLSKFWLCKSYKYAHQKAFNVVVEDVLPIENDFLCLNLFIGFPPFIFVLDTFDMDSVLSLLNVMLHLHLQVASLLFFVFPMDRSSM